MTSLILLVPVVLFVAAMAGMWSTLRNAEPRQQFNHPLAYSLVAAARRRLLTSLLLAVAVFAAAFLVGMTGRSGLGIPVLVAGPLAAAVALLYYSARPPRAARTSTEVEREASLERRTPWTYASRKTVLMPATAGFLAAAVSVFTGVTASPDEAGRYRQIAFHSASMASTASPYGGWFYATPLLLSLLILAVATFFAFWRVSSTPALPRHDLARWDAAWRITSTRVISDISTAATAFPVGGLSVVSGNAMRHAIIESTPRAWYWAGNALMLVGLAMLSASIFAFMDATLRTVRLPSRGWSAQARWIMESPHGEGGRG